MSSIVNGYMNAIERENDMFNRSIEIESNKISLMVEAYYNKLENDYLLAEQKVMMENGTYDDLTYLYMEANEEANQNKETIFQKIKAFFQRIFDSIKNLFRRGDAYEGNAPKCFMDAANGSGSSEIVNFFKKIGNDFKNGNVIGAIETLAKGGLTAFSVCVAIDKGVESASNIIHYPKKAYLKVKDWFDRLTSELQKIESELIAAAQNSNNEKATSFANEVKAKLGKIILWVKGKWEKFMSFFSGVKDKITGKDKEKDENGQSGEQDENGQSGEQGQNSEQSGEQGQNSEQSAEQGQNSEQSGDSSEQPNSKESDLTDDLKSQGNDLGKEMLALASAMNGTANMLKNKKIVSDDDLKDVYDAYNRAKKEKKIQTCYSCVTSMFTVLKNKTPKSQKQKIDEHERKLTIITNKYNKFSKELKEYTFESYYYLMYDYEIITESDECDLSITGDPLIDDVLIALNEF